MVCFSFVSSVGRTYLCLADTGQAFPQALDNYPRRGGQKALTTKTKNKICRDQGRTVAQSKEPREIPRYPSASFFEFSPSLAITSPVIDSFHHFLSFSTLSTPFLGRMALHLLLAVWLATVCALAQPQPPGSETIDVDLPPPDLPLPLIHFKLGDNRNIISSTKKKQSWNAFYTTTSGASAEEPATSSILVVSANGTTLPPYDTVVRSKTSVGRPSRFLTGSLCSILSIN